MKEGQRARWYHRAFDVGVGLKGVDGVLEIIGGVLVLIVDPAHISDLIHRLTQHELSEDPQDVVARYLVAFGRGFTTKEQLFGAVYLLTHGIVKLGLVAALLKQRHWAYPTAMVIFGLFALYQVYRFTFTHSLFLIVLTVFDAGVIWLTWLEYSRVKSEAT